MFMHLSTVQRPVAFVTLSRILAVSKKESQLFKMYLVCFFNLTKTEDAACLGVEVLDFKDEFGRNYL